MKIKNSEKIFKLEINHELNKPMVIKVWTDFPIDILNLEDKNINYVKRSFVDKRCVAYFSLNKDYKNQLRKELQDFINVGLNFAPDYLVHDDCVELLGKKLGNKYSFEKENITKIEYKNSNYKKLNLSFNAVWQHHNSNFYNGNYKIISCNFEKLKKSMPLSSDYNRIRIISSKLYEMDDEWRIKANNLYKFSICSYKLEFLYYVPIVRNEFLMFSSATPDSLKSNSSAKNIEYTIKIPYKPGIQNWRANKFYRKLDIVYYENETYEASEDNNSAEFNDSAWKKIKLKKHLSFDNSFSFFSTEYGANIFQKIKAAIPMQIEKNIADTITLCLVNSNTPKLNDSFSFHGKIFRIIGLSIYKGTHEFIEIIGQEVFNSTIELNNDYFAKGADYFSNDVDYFSQLNWIHDGQIGLPEVIIHNASMDVAKESFEGVELRIPSEAAISSRCDVNVKLKVGEL